MGGGGGGSGATSAAAAVDAIATSPTTPAAEATLLAVAVVEALVGVEAAVLLGLLAINPREVSRACKDCN